MSEWRQPSLVIPMLAKNKGKKSAKISIYEARLWKKKGKDCRHVIFPRGSAYRGYFEDKYRVQINGKWLNEPNFQYTFFTLAEIDKMISGYTVEALNKGDS